MLFATVAISLWPKHKPRAIWVQLAVKTAG